MVKKFLTKHFLEICVMDNATYFNNKNLIAWLGKSNIKTNFIGIRHPCAHLIERYIRERVKWFMNNMGRKLEKNKLIIKETYERLKKNA